MMPRIAATLACGLSRASTQTWTEVLLGRAERTPPNCKTGSYLDVVSAYRLAPKGKPYAEVGELQLGSSSRGATPTAAIGPPR
jgi:hypothetical protein